MCNCNKGKNTAPSKVSFQHPQNFHAPAPAQNFHAQAHPALPPPQSAPPQIRVPRQNPTQPIQMYAGRPIPGRR